MYKKIYSMLKNYINGENHWEYSLSISAFIVGVSFIPLAMIEQTNYLPYISCLMLFIGVCLLPDFKLYYIDTFSKGLLKFTLSIFAIILDILSIRKIVFLLMNKQHVDFYHYLIPLVVSFFFIRYYIDISYKILSTVMKQTAKNKDFIKKAWKLMLSLLGFLTSLITLINLIINFVN